jgi:5-oxopent-3-ene-1,2,5-tricarboxylate decarboxylase/2-hydroxyhepta-2,4-diene-1,7-dioate isomerase
MFSPQARSAQALQPQPLASGWPGTVLGVLMNDPASLAALGPAAQAAPYKAPPRAPVLYIKPRNTLIGPGQPISVPAGHRQLQMGPALGVVIGRATTGVGESEALACVAGYTVVNDVSLPPSDASSFYRPGLALRARDGFCPIAATFVPAARVPRPDDLALSVQLDDASVFEARTRGFTRPLARLIADISEFMTLHPGDVLLSGVPHGAPLAAAGQRVRIVIEGVGELANTLVAEEALDEEAGA